MASPGVKSTMSVIAMNIFFKFLRCGKGRAKFGSSICVGTAKLSTNRPSSIVWPQPCKQLSLLRVFLVSFGWLFSGGVFWVWIQVPVGSLGCLVQGSSVGMQGLLALIFVGLCSGLEGAFRGGICWDGFQHVHVPVFLLSWLVGCSSMQNSLALCPHCQVAAEWGR